MSHYTPYDNIELRALRYHRANSVFSTSYLGYVFQIIENDLSGIRFMPAIFPDNHKNDSDEFKAASLWMEIAHFDYRLICTVEVMLFDPECLNWIKMPIERVTVYLQSMKHVRLQPWWDLEEIHPGFTDAILEAEQRAMKRVADSRPKPKTTIARKTVQKDGYVYLLRSKEGLFKIGYSSEPDNRLKTFENKLPYRVEYHCLIETDDMRALEKELHQRFKKRRVKGEWFRLFPADVAFIEGLAKGLSIEELEQQAEADLLQLPLF